MSRPIINNIAGSPNYTTFSIDPITGLTGNVVIELDSIGDTFECQFPDSRVTGYFPYAQYLKGLITCTAGSVEITLREGTGVGTTISEKYPHIFSGYPTTISATTSEELRENVQGQALYVLVEAASNNTVVEVHAYASMIE